MTHRVHLGYECVCLLIDSSIVELHSARSHHPHIYTAKMGHFYETIPENIYNWILEQKMLFVSTAPLAASGHVNVSPKGGQYFGLIDDKTFWYMDLSGSGCETISHLKENGRITVMFCGFLGAPRIVRLWGFGELFQYCDDVGEGCADMLERKGD